MRVLVVKTSSLGDVVHTLPALSDAAAALPDVRFDWVVEETFAEIPSWHPAVDQVIPVAIRRWRKNLFRSMRSTEWKQCKVALRKHHYDCIIDAQGLLKSAWVARRAQGLRVGYDRLSVREPLAALSYHRRIPVLRDQHAVERTRQLFARALGYRVPEGLGDYCLDASRFRSSCMHQPRLVFLHGTTRAAKHWPEDYWIELARKAVESGLGVQLPWGSDSERERAERIAAASGADVLPRLNLHGIASVLVQADAVVAVDTGLGHLAAALAVPGVSLYGATRPALVGTYGPRQIHLTSTGLDAVSGIEPREMAPLTPRLVWQALEPLIQIPAGVA